jgi:hypothetical protein
MVDDDAPADAVVDGGLDREAHLVADPDDSLRRVRGDAAGLHRAVGGLPLDVVVLISSGSRDHECVRGGHNRAILQVLDVPVTSAISWAAVGDCIYAHAATFLQ